VERPYSVFPFREVPLRGGEIGFVNAPLIRSEVQNFKKELQPLIEDPFGVSEQVDQFLGLQIYTWAELMFILGILLSGEERTMICRAAMAIWKCEHPLQDILSQWLMLFPNQDPQWNNNTPGHRENMRDLRDLIIRGIRESVPWSQNLSKAFNVQQGKDERLTEFKSCLKHQMRKYAGLDLEDPWDREC
jgi:hypothetical protein